MKEVIVVGGGWAGLSASIELAKQGIKVRLLEASPGLGGRARSVPFEKTMVDNGQHLFIGGYKQYRSLLKTLQLVEDDLFEKHPFSWQMLGSKNVTLNLPNLPKPFNQVLGLFRATGLSIKDKWLAARFMSKLDDIIHGQDKSVELTLRQYKQSNNLVISLWDPMCLAALSTPMRKASSRVFARVLKDALTQNASFSSFWFAKKDLSEVLAHPAKAFIEMHQGQVHLFHRATELMLQDNEVVGVKTNKTSFYGPVILATPYWTTQKLLPPAHCQDILDQIHQLQSESISTLYIQYESSIELPKPMFGLTGTLSQWVFDRKFTGQKGLIAVVISGNGQHLNMSKEALYHQVALELKKHWPQCDKPLCWRLIHEKRGAFSCEVDVEKFRPLHITPLNHLYLAGDYTHTPYPSTLEGAVISGQLAAVELLKRYNNDEHPSLSLSLSA